MGRAKPIAWRELQIHKADEVLVENLPTPAAAPMPAYSTTRPLTVMNARPGTREPGIPNLVL